MIRRKRELEQTVYDAQDARESIAGGYKRSNKMTAHTEDIEYIEDRYYIEQK